MEIYHIPPQLPQNDSAGTPAQRLARAFRPLDVIGLPRVPSDEAIPTRAADPVDLRLAELADLRVRTELRLAVLEQDQADGITVGVTVLPTTPRRAVLSLLPGGAR